MKLTVVPGSYAPSYLELLRRIAAQCDDRWSLDRTVLNVELGRPSPNVQFRRELAYTLARSGQVDAEVS